MLQFSEVPATCQPSFSSTKQFSLTSTTTLSLLLLMTQESILPCEVLFHFHQVVLLYQIININATVRYSDIEGSEAKAMGVLLGWLVPNR